MLNVFAFMPLTHLSTLHEQGKKYRMKSNQINGR